MRRGYDNGLWIEDNKLIGVSLGADFTAEHEWGIEDIRSRFGISSKELGIKKRQIQKCPQTLLHKEDDKKQLSYLLYKSWWLTEDSWEKMMVVAKEVHPIQEKSGIGTAWCGNSFGIVFGAETRKFVPELVEAFKDLDIMIGSVNKGKFNPFSNQGLFLGIVSRLPKKWLQEMYDIDLDHKTRYEHPQYNDIQDILKKSGKKYFALSPSWKDDNKKDLKYWLNPMYSKEDQYGWYSYEDLAMWAEGKGPILKRST